MMPNTNVSPAASRNSRRANCNPFKICSTTSSIHATHVAVVFDRSADCVSPVSLRSIACRFPLHRRIRKSGSASGAAALLKQNRRSLHRAFVVEAVLIVLDDGRDRLQRELAVGIFDHVLQVEILDRNVVVAVFTTPAPT